MGLVEITFAAVVVLAGALVLATFALVSARRSKNRISQETRFLQEELPYGSLTTDRETGRITAANREAARLLGFTTAADLESRTLPELLTPPGESPGEAGENTVKSASPEGPVPEGPNTFYRPDGTPARLFVSGVLSGSEAATVFLADDAERFAAEAALLDLEDRYRTVLSLAPAVVYTTDPATGQTTLDASGWLDTLPGGPEIPVYPEDAEDLDAFRKRAVRLATEGTENPEKPQVIEYRATLGGRAVRLREEARVLVSGKEGPPPVRGFVTDVTGLRAAEDRYREALDINRAISYASGLGVAVRSRNRLFEINTIGADILGTTPEKVSGRVYFDFVHPDSERAARAGVRRTDRGDEEPRTRMLFRRDDGREVAVEALATPVRYADDGAAALLLFEDITAREQDRLQQRLAAEDLERRNSGLEQLVRSAAGDLAVALRALESDPETPSEASLTRMNRAVEDLSSLASLTETAMQTVDLSEISRSYFGPRSGRRDVEVIVAGGLTAEGDRSSLVRATEELLDNAWRAARRSPRPRIVVGRVEQAGEPVFFVRDNGRGFDMADAGRLFDPRRAPDNSDGGPRLSSAARIIERHGGQLWAESEPGKGATFYFTVPSASGRYAPG
ncbi:sensor histidine kinase [Rubrobacter indicoceani]|uniref:sensor histidine kinase n=1 Tax=Rubrobacter indicoceani TaxID=2051957 RepID=UPI0013C4EEB1|nr:PAS domain S-box protein [Rubrobacter indicoceani]